jgi:hypothetical protein
MTSLLALKIRLSEIATKDTEENNRGTKHLHNSEPIAGMLEKNM